MKRVLPTLFISLFAVALFAQNPTPQLHLTFKGVPIDGKLTVFTSQLRAKGFKIVSFGNGVAELCGDFAGYKDCHVFVSTLRNNDLVSNVAVYFPPCDNWKSIEADYLDLKSMLTTKYGEPFKCVEEFQNPYAATDDNSRMWELKRNRCDYHSHYSVLTGDISLSLVTIDGKCYVLLCYLDYLNGKAAKEAALEDL